MFFKFSAFHLIFIVLLISGCSDQKPVEQEEVLRPVKVLKVEAPSNIKVYEFTAVVDASRKADLAFKIAGEITQIAVKEGDDVEEGQLLAKLDDTDIQIQLKEAQSSFDKAKADYDRAQNLIKTNAISQSDLDQIKASYNSAEAKLAGASNNLEYTELKASFTGVVAKRYVDTFEEVNAKQPIFALHDLSNVSLKIELPEKIMIRAKRENAPPKLTAFFDALPGRSFPLTIKEIATQPDDVTKTYEVTLNMLAPEGFNILQGMTARVRGERADPDSPENFYLPARVVQSDSEGNYIFMVEQAEPGVGVVKKRKVVIGEINETGIEIYSGIEEGEWVLSAGMSKVSDGMRVKL